MCDDKMHTSAINLPLNGFAIFMRMSWHARCMHNNIIACYVSCPLHPSKLFFIDAHVDLLTTFLSLLRNLLVQENLELMKCGWPLQAVVWTRPRRIAQCERHKRTLSTRFGYPTQACIAHGSTLSTLLPLPSLWVFGSLDFWVSAGIIARDSIGCYGAIC